MGLRYGYDSKSSIDIGTSFAEVGDFPMTRDLRFGAALVLTSLPTAAQTLTLKIETFTGGNDSLGEVTMAGVTKPAGLAQFRIEFDRLVFLPQDYRVKVFVQSSDSNATGVYTDCYLYDANYASDLGALGGETLGTKWATTSAPCSRTRARRAPKRSTTSPRSTRPATA